MYPVNINKKQPSSTVSCIIYKNNQVKVCTRGTRGARIQSSFEHSKSWKDLDIETLQQQKPKQVESEVIFSFEEISPLVSHFVIMQWYNAMRFPLKSMLRIFVSFSSSFDLEVS